MEASNSVGNKIRLIRMLKGLSQENISLELGVSQKAYSKIERGETKLSVNMIEKLGLIFQMSPQDILNFSAENFIQTNSTYNSQSGGNNHFSLDNEHVNSLKNEISFLKLQISEKDIFIKSLLNKVK